MTQPCVTILIGFTRENRWHNRPLFPNVVTVVVRGVRLLLRDQTILEPVVVVVVLMRRLLPRLVVGLLTVQAQIIVNLC